MALAADTQELLAALRRGQSARLVEPTSDARFGRSGYQPFGAGNASPIRTFRASSGNTLYYAPTDRPGTSLYVGPGGSVRVSPEQFRRGQVLAPYGAGIQGQGLTVWDADPLEPGGFAVRPGDGSGLVKGIAQVLAIGAPIIAAPFLAAGALGAGGAAASGGGKAVLTAGGDVGLTVGNTAGAWDSVLSVAFPGAGIEAAAAPVGLSPSIANATWASALASSLPNISAAAPASKTLTLADTLAAARDVIGTGLGTASAVRAFRDAGRPTAEQASGYAPQLIGFAVPQGQSQQGAVFPTNAATLVVVAIVALVVVMAVKGK